LCHLDVLAGRLLFALRPTGKGLGGKATQFKVSAAWRSFLSTVKAQNSLSFAYVQKVRRAYLVLSSRLLQGTVVLVLAQYDLSTVSHMLCIDRQRCDTRGPSAHLIKKSVNMAKDTPSRSKTALRSRFQIVLANSVFLGNGSGATRSIEQKPGSWRWSHCGWMSFSEPRAYLR
jgi:hypothetical protein